jgi:hypothetical protein
VGRRAASHGLPPKPTVRASTDTPATRAKTKASSVDTCGICQSHYPTLRMEGRKTGLQKKKRRDEEGMRDLVHRGPMYLDG